MKRLMLITFVSLLAVVPVSAAEIYWSTPTGDATITDKDFKYEYRGATPAKSFRERGIYFNPGDPAPDWAADLFQSGRPAGAAVQSRVTDSPRPAVTAPIRETRPRVPRISPRPAETSPGSTQSIVLPPPETSAPAEKKKTQVRRSQRDTSTTQEVEKPESKKLRWGKTETKPAEDKSKFRWGQQQ